MPSLGTAFPPLSNARFAEYAKELVSGVDPGGKTLLMCGRAAERITGETDAAVVAHLGAYFAIASQMAREQIATVRLAG